MNPMEQAVADYRQADKALKEAAEKTQATERERDQLRQQLDALESNVTSAEQAHANTDAAQRLGETGDLEATQAALDAARTSLADAAPDLRHAIRVSDILVENLYVIAREAQEKHREALAALNAHWDAKLLDRLLEEVDEANRRADEWVAAQDKANATRQLIEERWQQAGRVAGWNSSELQTVYCKNPPHPDPDARMAHKQALQAEIAAATRV